jgi:hypothetical protein
MQYVAQITVNDSTTDGLFTKAKLFEYYKLGALIRVVIEGTKLAKKDDDLPLYLDIEADAKRFFKTLL